MQNKFLLIALVFISNLSQAALPDPVNLLQQYLKINTSQPEGNELESAIFLGNILKQYNIPFEIFEFKKGRANLMARLKGDGLLPPLILLHHMDVVPAEKKFWRHDPFSGEIEDGEIYGRGSIDIKSKGIMDLMLMLKLREENIKHHRDIIYLAVADEEANSLGSRWMIKHFGADLSLAEYMIDEGEYLKLDHKKSIIRYEVSIGEKTPLWLRFTFKGTPGHASIPNADNAVIKTVLAAKKVLDFAEKQPLKVISGTEDYLEISYKGDYTKLPGYSGSFKKSLQSEVFLKELAKDPELLPLLKNTISLTGLKGSDKINTIPNEAYFQIDCRLQPETNVLTFIEELKKAINEETTVLIEESAPTFTSPIDNSFFKALKAMALDLPIIPTILTSSTDSSLYRALGIKVYGLEFYALEEKYGDGPHGNNERMPIEALNSGIDRLYTFFKNLDDLNLNNK